jgi:hypothetical protein
MDRFLFLRRVSIIKQGIVAISLVIALVLSLGVSIVLLAHNAFQHVESLSVPSDGQGVYEYCAPFRGQTCFDRLQQIAAGGFRLVMNYEQMKGDATQEILYANQAQSVGIKIIWALDNPVFWNGTDLRTYYPDLAATCHCYNNVSFIRYFVNLVKNHTATWGYYIGDEVEPVNHAQLKAFSDLVHEADPVHPRLFVTYNVQKLAVFADSADVLAEDYYPIGEPDETVSGTGAVAHNVQSLADRHKVASGMVLQAHSLGEYPSYADLCSPFPSCMPYPTVSQMRQMHDLVLQNSHPRLVLWYSFFDMLKSDNPPQRWSNHISAAGTTGSAHGMQGGYSKQIV